MSFSLFLTGFFTGMFGAVFIGVFDGLFGEKALILVVTGGAFYLASVAFVAVERTGQALLPWGWYVGLVIGALFGAKAALDVQSMIERDGTPWVIHHVRRLQDA